MTDMRLLDDGLPRVAGRRLPTSIRDHERRLLICLRDEQAKPSPDTALIDTLCNAVRFVREHCDMVEKYLSRPLA